MYLSVNRNVIEGLFMVESFSAAQRRERDDMDFIWFANVYIGDVSPLRFWINNAIDLELLVCL